MPMNKVQFQHGLPMLEFFDTYGTQQQCEEVVRAWRWPQGFVCPRCPQTEHSEFRRSSRLYFQCSSCRYQCSLVAGTIFESSKLALPTWFVAMHLITQAKNGVSSLELKRHLGVSYPTAWLMKHKIMEVMLQREDSRQLTGRVEIQGDCMKEPSLNVLFVPAVFRGRRCSNQPAGVLCSRSTCRSALA